MTSFLWSIRVQGKKTAVNFLISLDNRERLIYNIDIFAQEISPPHLPFLCFILFIIIFLSQNLESSKYAAL